MKDITIKDLYVGKLDAKDEFDYGGTDNFIKTFVVADHFNIDGLIKGDYFFITGFKGTGKTALLFYLDDKFRELDPQTYSSYILFKEYTSVERDEIEKISKRNFSTIAVDTDSLKGTHDFEYVWRWIILKRIVSDNEANSRNIFVDNEQWRELESLLSKIKAPRNNRMMRLFDRVKLSVPLRDPASNSEIAPTIDVDFNKQNSDSYSDFVDILNKSEDLLSTISKTDIPYYIFVDELEAYSGNDEIFKRDLCLIRDLILTVKRFNTIFAKSKFNNIRIICSVRTEIINAIQRTIVTKEINKVISSFSLHLNWNYTNGNSYAHPIMEVLLKRISVCDEADNISRLELYRKWFPENIHRKEASNYILNNTWYKPRDIIRLLIAAQSSLYNNSKCFNNAVIDSLTKQYSIDSLEEIREELRALYTPEEIDSIIGCFTGFKSVFSVQELKKRIEDYYTGTILHRRFNLVLNDLYRLGFIGNHIPSAKVYRWKHRGDQTLILDDKWDICIHSALRSALSLSRKTDYTADRYMPPFVGDIFYARIRNVQPKKAKIVFEKNNQQYFGTVGIRAFKNIIEEDFQDLREVISEGDTFKTEIIRVRGDKYELKLLEF